MEDPRRIVKVTLTVEYENGPDDEMYFPPEEFTPEPDIRYEILRKRWDRHSHLVETFHQITWRTMEDEKINPNTFMLERISPDPWD